MRRATILALMASAIPAAAYAQQAPVAEPAGDQCGTLVTTIQAWPNANLPITLDRAQALRQSGDTGACADALAATQTALADQAGGQPSAPQPNDAGMAQAQGQQPIGRPTPGQQDGAGQAVAQAQAEVTVQQGVPEITITQPAPVITIDIPRPEIVVRMPQPQLSVQTSEPQTANMDVQPIVRYEQAEPRVVINRAEGDPTVRFEQADPGQQLVAGAAGNPADNNPSAQASPTQAGQSNLQQQAALGQPGQFQTQSSGESVTLSAGELVGMDVVDETGQRIGTVDQFVHFTPENQNFVVIDHDGAMNLGDKKIGIAVNDLRYAGDRLQVVGTAQELQSFPAWQPGAGYVSVPDGQNLDIPRGG